MKKLSITTKRNQIMETVSINKTMEWIAEADYCDQLVTSGGNNDVPASSVLNYLTMQAIKARREGFATIADKLDDLILLTFLSEQWNT